jgi:hypothetical protein
MKMPLAFQHRKYSKKILYVITIGVEGGERLRCGKLLLKYYAILLKGIN